MRRSHKSAGIGEAVAVSLTCPSAAGLTVSHLSFSDISSFIVKGDFLVPIGVAELFMLGFSLGNCFVTESLLSAVLDEVFRPAYMGRPEYGKVEKMHVWVYRTLFEVA